MSDGISHGPVPRTVAAGRGSAWLAEGFELFKRAPGVWIGITLVWFIVSALLGAVDAWGALANAFLNPIFQAGILIGCAAAASGSALRFDHLFAGFRTSQVGQLLLMSVFLIAMLLGAGLLFMLTAAGTLKGAFGAGAEAVDTTRLLSALLAALLAAALAVPVAMCAWFAPALIVFHKLGAWQAIRLSFQGCLKNLLPFLVYGVLGLVLLIVACLPLLLGLLVAIPVIAASVYASYRDISR